MRGVGELLNLLHEVKTTPGGQWQANCPAHPDTKKHLYVKQEGEKLLVKCQHGCTTEAICDALHLTLADLFIKPDAPVKAATPTAPRGQITATYDYVDETGQPLFQVVRMDPKDFRQRHKNGAGEWEWNLNGVRRVLYHLPQVTAASTVWLVEGEKDVESLEKAGITATTSPGGAGGWKTEYGKPLEGKTVVIVPDRDPAGMEYARQVAKTLEGKAKVKVILLPEGEGKDISDWLALGKPLSDLESLTQPPSCLFEAKEPSIEDFPGGYTLTWDSKQVSIEVTKVDTKAAGAVSARLKVTTTLPAYRSSLLTGRYTVTSHTNKRDLAKDLKDRCKEVEWLPIVEDLCAIIEDRAKEGEPPELIDTSGEIEPVRFCVYPILLEEQPNIVFGPKGVNKSRLAMLLACLARLGPTATMLGLRVDSPSIPVLYADWEADAKTFKRRLQLLSEGMDFGYCELNYRRFSGPIHQSLDAFQSALHKTNAKLVIVDSLGPAAGKDLNGDAAPIEFYDAIRSVKCSDGSIPTFLIIAHQSKGKEGEKSIFGSVFFGNLARSIWELRKHQEPGQNSVETGLFHREANDIRIHHPIGLKWSFQDDAWSKCEAFDLRSSSIEDSNLDKLRLLQFLSHGPKSLDDCSDFMALKPNHTSVLLSRLKSQGSVLNPSRGLWAAISHSPFP